MSGQKNKKNLEQYFSKTSKGIQPEIEKILTLYVDKKFQDLARYQILSGGKRIRPALTILSSQLFGGSIRSALGLAAALEILHNYSLIIDDIIDNSVLRRGQKTTWAKYGKAIAQCISIDYAAAIFQEANRSKKPVEVSELLAKVLKKISDGEILDILFEQAGREEEPYILKHRYRNITEKDYFEMVGKKTAILFQTCCEIGALCGNANARQLKAVRSYGYNLGLAFQMRDDILDIFGEEKKFGKKIGKDIEERKGGNIVIYFANQEFLPKDKKEFWQIIRRKKMTKENLERAINLIKKTHAKERALNYSRKIVEKTKTSLKLLPQNKYNRLLEEITDLVVERQK